MESEIARIQRLEKMSRLDLIRPVSMRAIEEVMSVGQRFSSARGYAGRLLDECGSSLARLAEEHAKSVQRFALPSALESYRSSIDSLTSRLIAYGDQGINDIGGRMEAFSSASAMSNLLDQRLRVDYEITTATKQFSELRIPSFQSIASYRHFLDATGLTLPRWPRIRLLSRAEKRKKFKARLRQNAESKEAKAAKSLVQRYELALREVIDDVMTTAYGEDWPMERLPLCGNGKGLLGRWKARGGDVLDHADYAHYIEIMTHPDHFESAFMEGFEDPDELRKLLEVAGYLRATSHHARPFALEDLRDLRLTWRMIEKGLIVLSPDYDVG